MKRMSAANKNKKVMDALERGSYSVAYALLKQHGPVHVSYDWGDDRLFDGARRVGITVDTTDAEDVVLSVNARGSRGESVTTKRTKMKLSEAIKRRNTVNMLEFDDDSGVFALVESSGRDLESALPWANDPEFAGASL